MIELSDFEKLVLETTKRIPKGRLSTYSEIAKSIGKPGASRAVGNALNKNPFAPVVPCHRVVRADATLGGFASGQKAKKNILQKEGIKFERGKVVDFKVKFIKL